MNAQARKRIPEEELVRIRSENSCLDLLQARGIETRRDGPRYIAKCPLHEDGSPSFTIYRDNSWFCYGCQVGGDVIDLVARLDGLSFLDAAHRLGARDETGPAGGKVTAQHKAVATVWPDPPPVLDRRQSESGIRSILRLLNDEPLQTRIAEARSWRVETVRALAENWDLGFLDSHEIGGRVYHNALVFLSNWGLKIRAGFLEEVRGVERVIRIDGSAGIWRAGCHDSHELREAGRVLLCEGETDAVSALDSGLWDGYHIASAPSANLPGWAVPFFAGKRVTLAFDSDEAGQKAAQRAARDLRAVRALVTILNLQAR